MHKTLKWAELETILRQGRIERIERIGRIESKNREKGKKSEIMVKKKKEKVPGDGEGDRVRNSSRFWFEAAKHMEEFKMIIFFRLRE